MGRTRTNMSAEGRGSAPPPSEDKIEKKPFLSWENIVTKTPFSWDSLDYDVLLTKLGEFGNFQRKALLWLWLPAFVGGIVVVTAAFSVMEPEFDGFYCKDASICSTDRAGNITSTQNQSSPHFPAPGVHLARKPHYYRDAPEEREAVNDCFPRDGPDFDSDPVHCEKRCGYDNDYVFIEGGNVMTSSVVMDTKMMCVEEDVSKYKAICDSFFMVGYFIGGFIFGTVADAEGRKPAIFLAILFCTIGTALSPTLALIFGTNDWVHALTMIVPGAGSMGAYLMAFTLSVEIVGKTEQFPGIPWNATVFAIVGNAIAIPFALGEATNGLVAYILPDWIHFQFGVAVLCGLPIVAWFFIPESPRWLIERKLAQRTKAMLVKIAEENKKDLPLPRGSNVESMHGNESVITEIIHEAKDAFWDRQKGLFQGDIRAITLALFLLWSVTNLVYYGTIFGIEELHLTKSAHVNPALVGLIEIPAYIVTALVMSSSGRKPILIFSFLAIFIATFIASFLAGHEDAIAVLMLGAHMFSAACFATVRIYTSEIYPTHIRATALGAMKSVSCVGAILAPWVGGYFLHAFPEANAGHLASLISYAVFSGLACALSFLLADTVGFPLPENFEDVRRIKKNQKPLLAWVSKDWQPAENKPGPPQ